MLQSLGKALDAITAKASIGTEFSERLLRECLRSGNLKDGACPFLTKSLKISIINTLTAARR